MNYGLPTSEDLDAMKAHHAVNSRGCLAALGVGIACWIVAVLFFGSLYLAAKQDSPTKEFNAARGRMEAVYPR